MKRLSMSLMMVLALSAIAQADTSPDIAPPAPGWEVVVYEQEWDLWHISETRARALLLSTFFDWKSGIIADHWEQGCTPPESSLRNIHVTGGDWDCWIHGQGYVWWYREIQP